MTGLTNEMLPLYIIVALGFIAGKLFTIELRSISQLTIYVMSPVVFVLSIAQIDFTPTVVVAPVVTLVICALLGSIVFKLCKSYLSMNMTSVAALSSGTSNWGYFGLPVAFILFTPQQIAFYIMLGFGLQIFENTFGIYFMSRSDKNPLESFLNIFKFPVFYSITLGIILSYMDVTIPPMGLKILEMFKSAYTVTGMMIIGLGLATMTHYKVDWKFVTTTTLLKFAIWPAIAVGFIWLDNHLHILGDIWHVPLLLLSIMPMGANNVAFAAQFKNNPDKVAMAVLITTLIALVYIPFMVKFFGI